MFSFAFASVMCSTVVLWCRYLVFHGGSGSTKEEIKTAVVNGVVKMNVDTDTQFAYLAGIRVCSAFAHPWSIPVLIS